MGKNVKIREDHLVNSTPTLTENDEGTIPDVSSSAGEALSGGKQILG